MYIPQKPKLDLLECLGPFGAYRRDRDIVVFRLIDAVPQTIYEFPLVCDANYMQIACELQSGEVAVVLNHGPLIRQIVWQSEGRIQTASLNFPQYGGAAVYVYQNNIIAAVPEGTRISGTKDVVAIYQKVEDRPNTIVFPNGLAADLFSNHRVINLNELGRVCFSSSDDYNCYWQLDSVMAVQANRCYQITPQQTRLVAKVTEVRAKPVVFEAQGTLRLMIVHEDMAVVDDVAFLLPSSVLPACFVTERGVYFDCFGRQDVPAYRIVSFYSFSDGTVTDILISCEEGTIKVLPPRGVEKWERVVAAPEEIKVPEEWDCFPGLSYKVHLLQSAVWLLEKARANASLLLREASG